MSFQRAAGTSMTADTTWVITEQLRQNTRQYFKSIDVQNSGFIDVNTAKYFFSLSGLSSAELTKIWMLCHISKDTGLDFCKFQVVMLLVLGKLSGREIPDQLPASLLESVNANNSGSAGSAPPIGMTEVAEVEIPRNVFQDLPLNFGSETGFTTAARATNKLGASGEAVNDFIKQVNTNLPQATSSGSGGGLNNQSMPGSNNSFTEKLSSSMPSTLADLSPSPMYEAANFKDAATDVTTPFASATEQQQQLKKQVNSENILLNAAAHALSPTGPVDESARPLSPPDALPVADSYTVGPEARNVYDRYFGRLDEKNTGYVSREAVRAFSARLGLPDTIFGSVWALSDLSHSAQLSNREFYIFLHLSNLWRRGYKLPTQLPQQLVGGGVNPLIPRQCRASESGGSYMTRSTDGSEGADVVQKHEAQINELLHEKEALLQEVRQQWAAKASKAQKFNQIDQKCHNMKHNTTVIEMQVESVRNKMTNLSDTIIEAENYILTLTRQLAYLSSLLAQKQSQRESERAALSSFHEKLRHMILSLVKQQNEESAQTKANP